MIGTTISRYHILEEIGRGGMGVVYRARDTTLDREVALKALSGTARMGGDLKRRLLTEARALAAVHHPGITIVHEIDERDGTTFIVMELVRGRALSRLLSARELTPVRAVELAIDIADTLGAVHGCGLVHRDIKPANVIVTPEGRAKLIDFGLAKMLGAQPRPGGAFIESDGEPTDQTTPGALVGTIGYLSPEQVRGKPIDLRSDVFAFGVLLYEMLSFGPPFRGGSVGEMLIAIVRTATPALPALAGGPRLTRELQRVVNRCMSKEREARYPDMASVAEDLRSVLEMALAADGTAEHRIRAILVDDEELTRTVLRAALAVHTDIEVVAECADGFEAVQKVVELRPDLLFLDVQMPKLGGFEVAELIGTEVDVIFVTAFDTFAVRAMEMHAVDYVVKPVEPERLAEAVDRARRRARRRQRAPARDLAARELAAAAAGPRAHLQRVLVRRGARAVAVPVERIDYATARIDGVLLRVGAEEYLKEEPLDDLAARLDPDVFVRIHPDCLLNVERLDHVAVSGTESVAILEDGTRLPVSPDGYRILERTL